MGRFLESMGCVAAYAACLGIAMLGVGCGGESVGERAGLRFEGTEPGDCSDDADNDADGLFDCNDPGCAGAATCSGGGSGGIGGAAGISGSGGIGGAAGMSGSGGIAGSGGMGGSGGIGGAGGIGGGCEENSCSNFDGGAECGVIPTRCGGEEQAIFCGTCLGSQVCIENRCVCPAGADCGEGCGGGCGPDEVCVEGECCEPTYPCAENECSPPGGFPDGCGGITQCPECRDGEDCVLSNELVFECLGGAGGMGGTGGNACQSVTISPTRSIPNIMVIVDRSGSMRRDFDGDCPFLGDGCPSSGAPNPDFDESRWESVEDALVGSNGLVRRLDSIARFGLTLYWKPGEDPPSMSDGAMCASTDGVSFGPSLDNADPIAATFVDNSPSGFTPTAEAIEAVTSSLISTPPPEGPTVYLLATDGAPDGCDEDGEVVDRNNSIAAVERAFGLGIETFVLGVNFDDSHLQDLANAGQGVGSGATLWTANSVSELEADLEQIISSTISCDIQMDKRFDDKEKACNDPESDVRLNGVPLSCPSEWRVKPGVDDIIELVGSACDTFKSGDVTFSAEFPCGAIVVE